jgi:hypothetical protein
MLGNIWLWQPRQALHDTMFMFEQSCCKPSICRLSFYDVYNLLQQVRETWFPWATCAMSSPRTISYLLKTSADAADPSSPGDIRGDCLFDLLDLLKDFGWVFKAFSPAALSLALYLLLAALLL